MFEFYRNAITHCQNERQYDRVITCLRRAKSVDNADYAELIKVLPAFAQKSFTQRIMEKIRR